MKKLLVLTLLAFIAQDIHAKKPTQKKQDATSKITIYPSDLLYFTLPTKNLSLSTLKKQFQEQTKKLNNLVAQTKLYNAVLMNPGSTPAQNAKATKTLEDLSSQIKTATIQQAQTKMQYAFTLLPQTEQGQIVAYLKDSKKDSFSNTLKNYQNLEATFNAALQAYNARPSKTLSKAYLDASNDAFKAFINFTNNHDGATILAILNSVDLSDLDSDYKS